MPPNATPEAAPAPTADAGAGAGAGLQQGHRGRRAIQRLVELAAEFAQPRRQLRLVSGRLQQRPIEQRLFDDALGRRHGAFFAAAEHIAAGGQRFQF